MSSFPAIPEFTNTFEGMAATIRALKLSVEMLAGMRQGESFGAPQVFVQGAEPNRALTLTYKKGDLWIDTSTNRVHFWTGSGWQIV